jgi:hypothetical protein
MQMARSKADTYLANISLLDACPQDVGQIPTISLSYRLSLRGKAGELVQPLSAVHEQNLWVISVRLPRDHRYVLFTTTHCATRVQSVAVAENRDYSSILRPGNGPADLEEREAGLYGLLPFDGITSVDLVAPQSDLIVLASARIQGRGYYFESVPYAEARLRINFPYSSVIVASIKLNDPKARWSPLFVRHDVTLSEIMNALRSNNGH